MTTDEREKIKLYLIMVGWLYDDLDCDYEHSLCWWSDKLDNWYTYEQAYNYEQTKHTERS
jgi:hypothetical protein